MPLGSLWGIRLRLNPLFILFGVFWVIAGSPFELALVCLIVLVHELAHGLAGKTLGLRINEIELYPFGGVARIEEKLELEPRIERRLAWAGPAANLVMAGLSVALYHRLFPGSDALLFFFRANMTLAVFNLLPALPLDGGRILRARLTPLLGFRSATETAASFGQILAVLLFAAGLLSAWQSYLNLSLLCAGVFLFISATREKKQAVYAFLRSLGAKEHQLFKRGALRGEQLVVLEETRLVDVFRLFAPQRYHFVRIMDRSQHCRGEITETTLIRAALRKGLDIPIKKIL